MIVNETTIHQCSNEVVIDNQRQLNSFHSKASYKRLRHEKHEKKLIKKINRIIYNKNMTDIYM